MAIYTRRFFLCSTQAKKNLVVCIQCNLEDVVMKVSEVQEIFMKMPLQKKNYVKVPCV